MTVKPKTIAWVLAAIGGSLGVAAAWYQGGLFPALTAASVAFTGAAGLLGYNSSPPSTGAPQ